MGGGSYGDWGLTLNPMGEIIHSVIDGYNLVIVKDIDIGSSDSYTECYWQIVYGILDISTPRSGKLLNISRSVDIPTLKTYIYICSLCQSLRASNGI